MAGIRVESDSMGKVDVPADKLWGPSSPEGAIKIDEIRRDLRVAVGKIIFALEQLSLCRDDIQDRTRPRLGVQTRSPKWRLYCQKRMNTWCAQNICFKSSSRRSNRTITGAIALAVYSVRCKLIWISFRVSGSPKNRSAPLISAGARKSVEIARPKPSSCSFAKASCDPVAE